MSPRQWIIIGFAAVAGTGALVLAQTSGRSAEASVVVEETAPEIRVLVARRAIPLGAAITPEDLQWMAWGGTAPEGYVVETAQPKAIEEFTGAIARVDMKPGEPVFPDRLVKRGDQSVFAAILGPGMRAFALEVSPATSSAGFIQPNDRVDVLMTRTFQVQRGGSTQDEVRAGVLFENVRVMSMGEIVRQPQPGEEGPEPIKATVATLELTPAQAQKLAVAIEVGKVSLALRSVGLEPSAASARSVSLDAGGIDAQVRVHSFGVARDIDIGGAQ